MEIKEFNANQIISSGHEILHDIQVLKIYYQVFKTRHADIIPPAPVMRADLISPQLEGDLLQKYQEFRNRNPQADYFLLDGSHKTTAADLCGLGCRVILVETQQDIEDLRQMEKTGDIFQFMLEDTIKENIADLIGHFKEHSLFQTVREKTERLANNRRIPEYMYSGYRR